jgi:hypothetical protein
MRSLAVLALAAATAASPLTWKKTTPYAEVGLTLPKEVLHAPVLNERLHRGEIKALEAFAASAGDPKDGLRGDAPAFRAQGKWSMEVTYRAGVETPRLISLVRTSYEDTHGAHPNHSLGGVVFDKAKNRNLHPLDLLRPGADLHPLDKALCDAARAAKRERNDQWNETEDTNFSCPTWKGIVGKNGKLLEGTGPAQITLAEGDSPSHAAGLVFLYSPYDLGAYAEGEYEVLVPAAVFRATLKPDYAAEFAGKPRPFKQAD